MSSLAKVARVAWPYVRSSQSLEQWSRNEHDKGQEGWATRRSLYVLAGPGRTSSCAVAAGSGFEILIASFALQVT